MEHIYWLAWHVEHRCKQTTLDYEAWLDTLADLSHDDPEQAEADTPLPSAP
jgi:hypothetical protein